MSMRKIVVGLVEPVKIKGTRDEVVVLGKFDTGAQRTSIDKRIADKVGAKPIGKVDTHNVHGKTTRPVANFEIEVKGKRLNVKANISDRSSRKFKVLLGRDIIYGNFVIDITKSHKSHRLSDLR